MSPTLTHEQRQQVLDGMPAEPTRFPTPAEMNLNRESIALRRALRRLVDVLNADLHRPGKDWAHELSKAKRLAEEAMAENYAN